MSWTISYLEAEKTILIATVGASDMTQALQKVKKAGEMAARLNVRRFLMDNREALLEVSTMDIYEFPKILFENGIPRKSRVAIVVSGDPRQTQDFEFFRTRMFNEGTPDVRLFGGSLEPALTWLAESPSLPQTDPG